MSLGASVNGSPNILGRLKNVRRSGNGWSARCPAHDDAHASLSIGVGDNGKPLLYCHKGCDYRHIADAIGLRQQDGGPGLPPRDSYSVRKTYGSATEAAIAAADREGGRVTAEYIYDRFRVIRIDLGGGKKSFRPIYATQQGWVVGYPEGQRDLYRIAEVLAADATRLVFVVEGEKCVDALRALGELVTTSAGGAKAAGKTDWSPLRGRHIIIVPDNDKPGADYANDVKRLLENIAASTVVVRLPGLAEAGDVVDFIEARPEMTLEEIKHELELLVSSARAATAAVPSTRSDGGERTVIEYAASRMFEAVRQAIEALAKDGRIYRRANRLVEVVAHKARSGSSVTIDRAEGAPIVAEVSGARLAEILSEKIDWKRYDKRTKDWEGCAPPKDVVAAIIDRRQWEGVKPLAGIVCWPVIRPDGSLLSAPGYDEATALMYVPTGVTVEVSDAPTRADAERALADILDAVCDFPFADDAAKAAFVAALLTVLALPAIDTTPIFQVLASTPGTGKTLLVDIVSIIVCGRRVARTPYVREDEEMRKQITAAALDGDTMILIDNVPGGYGVGWPALDAAVTGDEWHDRRLGKSENVRLPFKAVWFMTGNNLGVRADAGRRTLRIKLETQQERPEERAGFKHDPILPWVRQERGRLLSAALTILRAFVVAGLPQPKVAPLGSFEQWSMLVRGAVIWLGLEDPAETSAAKDPEADLDRAAHAQAMLGWLQLDPDGRGVTVAEALKNLGKAPLLKEALTDLCQTKDGEPPTARALGFKLRALRGRARTIEVGGERVEASFDAQRDRNDVSVWRVKLGVRDMRDIAGYPHPPRARDGMTLLGNRGEPCPASPAYPAADDQADLL